MVALAQSWRYRRKLSSRSKIASGGSQPIRIVGQSDTGVQANVARAPRYQSLWEVALTLFAERGYRGTTMRDIAHELGIQAPSLYNHLRSKQEILRDIVFGTMERAFAAHHAAVDGVEDVAEQLRRASETHARLAINYRREVLITHREIPSLEEPDRALVIGKQKEYVRGFRAIIERGCSLGRFNVESPRVASFAVLEMLNGLERWYSETGQNSEADVVRQYGEFALRIVEGKDAEDD